MSLLDSLFESLGRSSSYRQAHDMLASGEDASIALPGLARPLLVAALFRKNPRPILVTVAGEEAAERFARNVRAYLPGDTVLDYPDRADLPWSDSPSDAAVVGARARAIHALGTGDPVIVVTSARALLRALPPQGSTVFEPLVIERGTTLDLEAATSRLAGMGYERLDLAEEPGTFAVRGGILDVYPAGATHPVRVELYGDDVDSLRRFVPSTGQTIDDEQCCEVFPCRELALSKRTIAAAEKSLKEASFTHETLAHHLELMQQGVYFTGIERYLPKLYRVPGTLAEFAHTNALFIVAEPRSLFDDMTRRTEELEPLAHAAGVRLAGLYLSPAEVDLGDRQRLTLLSLMRAAGGADAELATRRPEVSGGEEKFLGGVRSLLEVDYSVLVAVPDRRTRGSLADTMSAAGVRVAQVLHPERSDDEVPPAPLPGGVVHFAPLDIPAGFVIPEARLAVISLEDIVPRSTNRRASRQVDPTKLTFAFSPGDYVVHSVQGIALFKEFKRQEVAGVERDYLVLEYAAGDKLHVPIDQIDRITRYVGPDGSAPRLTRLNTADWARATRKAKKAARQLAFDLVDLYARRATVAGHMFGPDSPWQMEMEAMFPFEETPDQLAAIADVKADMESEKPMDRLVCGDVGYGKTEVAIRATFKAVQDAMQVMILCPTTILAQQHFTSFSERFEPFGVKVEVLSRFRNPAEQKAALEGFASGTVDILVGTHRLLSRDVNPRRLGLVVVDEEQRFGVQHKEHLKNLREQVDVLTLSATPIPRTLQMSLSGVRDMSVIDTPPPGRFPVQVHVGEYDAELVSGAIRREIERGGQVYYVSNRVRTIEEAVERVRFAAPEARIGVAHGQMSEQQLERIMESFSANEFDVLVATTIIESGIDNPHTNTLVIEDSQRLGLAQLYQLKGRVGRSHVKAYAYFMFPRESALTEEAQERLTAIAEHTEFGSGIRIAMRDLEIRGAGSLLGAEQSGNLSAVGFDLFANMLQEAVAEVRGEPPVAFPDVKVDLPVAAYLPEDYVDAVDERVRYYRRLAGAPAIEVVARIAAEIEERFGPLPEPAVALLEVARIRALAADAGVTSVALAKKKVVASPTKLGESARQRFVSAGGQYVEHTQSASVVIEYGESVTAAAERLLNGILSAA